MQDASGRFDPTFSVVVPTRNRPELLARCLDQLAPGRQSIDSARYDVIVTDDSDGDDTHQLLLASYSWARWTRGPRRGPAANRNAGARLAGAPFLVFVDDDCIPDATWLAGFMPATTHGWDISSGRTVCREPWVSPLDHAPLNDSGEYIWSCNVLVRRDAFVALGGFDERYPYPHMEDRDLQVRAKARNVRAGFSADAVVDHPPRRLAWGAGLGRLHYAHVLFATIHGMPISLPALLRRITAARVRAVIARPAFIDGLSATASWLMETLHVVTNWRGWRRRAASVAQQ